MTTKQEIRQARELVWRYLIDRDISHILVQGEHHDPWHKIWIDNETLFVQMHETHTIYINQFERRVFYSELLPTLSPEAYTAYQNCIHQCSIPPTED